MALKKGSSSPLKAILLALLVSVSAHAAGLDATVTAGVGKNIIAKAPGGFERYGSLGLRYGGTWKVALNGGYWLAQADEEKASLFASMQGGLEIVGQGGTFATFMIGPAHIQNPDAKLNGHWHFHPVFGFGVKDKEGYSLAGEWSHWSNAGFVPPNRGRDIICLKAVIPLYRGAADSNR